jgi:type VI secretion system secreted protein Hcp
MKLNPSLSKTLALVAPVTILTVSNTFGASDYFLKLDGVKGESKNEKHKDWIDIQSFSWGMTNTPATGGGEGKKATLQDFNFTMKVDKASPSLMLACATGQRIKYLTFAISREGADGSAPGDYYVVTLTDVLISSYQSGGSTPPAGATAELPTASVSINYHKIKWDYIPADQSGPVSVEFEASPTP